LYYHLRLLTKLGLVKEWHELRFDGRAEAVYDVPGPIRIQYLPRDRRHTRAVIRSVGAMVRSSLRSFAKAYTPQTVVVEGPRRNLWSGRMIGWLAEASCFEGVYWPNESANVEFRTGSSTRSIIPNSQTPTSESPMQPSGGYRQRA